MKAEQEWDRKLKRGESFITQTKRQENESGLV